MDPSVAAGKIPKGFIVASMLSCASLAAGVILSIIAIAVGVMARRRIRREPDNWTGGRRALAGMLLGIAGVAGPPALLVVPSLLALLRSAPPG